MQDLELDEVFKGGHGSYWLASLVGFYGQHYFAFVRQADESWLQFDDASVRPLLSLACAACTFRELPAGPALLCL